MLLDLDLDIRKYVKTRVVRYTRYGTYEEREEREDRKVGAWDKCAKLLGKSG